jgi:hypothetical protein
MIGTAEITRDPLYAIPLAGNPRYRELRRRHCFESPRALAPILTEFFNQLGRRERP